MRPAQAGTFDDVGVLTGKTSSPARPMLEAWPPWEVVPLDVRQELTTVAVRRSLARGSLAFRRTERCAAVGIVGSGTIRVFSMSDEGREITLYRVGPGETCLLTLTCVLGGTVYPAHAVCETDTEVALLPAEDFRRSVDASPDLAKALFAFIAGHTTQMLELIEALFLPLDRRLAGSLLTSFEAGDRLEKTHVDLAADVGSTREVVSRVLKEFERRGAVGLGRGRIDLRDRTILESLRGDLGH